MLKRMFGDSWGPRLEHILRNTLLALLDRPSTTLLDISRMLTDKEFRKETLSYCRDVTVLQFWKQEFGQWNEKQVNESIAPVLNKVGAFTANPIVRNIIGQTKSSFDIRQIMDEGKILVVNLSKGLIGEDNAGILGAFLVTKVQLAAMSRSDIPRVEDRRPFYLYVDEFQNFATDSFAVILSEARKYGLNLTVANQYIAQMTDTVRDAVFGNVGTTISFRVSPEDAPFLAKQFEPTFEAGDLVQLNNRNFVISMIINGEKVPAFSASTLSLPQTPQDNFAAIVQASRAQYSRPRATVEAEIKEAIEASEKYKQNLSDSGREAGSRGGGGGAIASGAPKLTFKELGATSVSVSPAASDSPTSANASDNQSSTSTDDNQSGANAGNNQSGANANSSNEINLKKLERGKISPNTATGKQVAGLKDLGALVAEAKKEVASKATASDVATSATVTPLTSAQPASASAEAGKSIDQNTKAQTNNQAHQASNQNANGRKKHKRSRRRR